MAVTITSDLVEAYSLCPRKAFLLMTGATTDPGPHDYELLIRGQVEANRQARRSRLAQVGEVVPFQWPGRPGGGSESTRGHGTDYGCPPGTLRLSREGGRALAAGTAQLRDGDGDRHLQSVE